MDARDANIFRLAKPKRKGLLSLLFSRLLIIVLLMALQLVVLDGLFVWLKQYLHWISLLQGLFTAAMVIYLFNSNMDSSARLTWMFLIAIFPLPAAALLYFTQTNVGHRLLSTRTAELIEATRTSIPQDPAIPAALKKDGSGTDDLDRYL